MKNAVLLADVGGTNVRMALYRGEEITFSTTYQIRHFDSFESAVCSFLAKTNADVDRFIIGAAGIKKNNVIRLTNYHWSIDATALKALFHLREVILVNDFSLQGLGLVECEKADYISLGGLTVPPDGTRAVIGAGTGLGICFLSTEQENACHIVESEGGHSSIGSISKGMTALNQAAANKVGYVSFERIVSGPGLMFLYRLLADEEQHNLITELTDEINDMREAFSFALQNQSGKNIPSPENIQSTVAEPTDITYAAQRGDETALLVWWLFLKYLAVFCSDMALTFKTTGGVYLVGALLNDTFVRCLLDHFPFRFVFEQKGILKAYLKQIPVCLIVKKDIALSGLKYIAHHSKNW